MPSGLWKPDVIPRAESSASPRPDRIVIGTPHTFSARLMKARPLRASRHAAVAIAHSLPTCMARHSARKRTSAAIALSTASSASSPVDSTSRPRPASTFSLKIGVRLRVRPS